ncbi:MAG TPA: DNA-processing protein DprA [Candidatus Sulfotelmatobacter sp.]|jgi:DNA processing protein|nr:DNA-processing protein DprA [Candidatus Sulfotelmatobacter sp.]
MSNSNRLLTERERLDWLRLYRSENVGPVTFFKLLERFGSAGRALEVLPDLAKRGGGKKPISVYAKAAAEREMAALQKLGGQMIAACEPGFPPALRSLETAPLLTCRGNSQLLPRSAIALVGARNASAAGRRMAYQLAAELGRSGLLVVSGLARGIDTAAHEGSLGTGTVAVLAGGLDVIYPPENQDLYDRICDAGAVISEMPPGATPQAMHFPRRNRLISGMSLGVVVVEAAPRSGSLITARLGLEQGREIFAVPGSPLDPRCQGPNGLIKQGATLTETAADVMEVLSGMLRHSLSEPSTDGFSGPAAGLPDESALNKAHRVVAECLSPVPVTTDEILRQSGLSSPLLSMVLLELELAGRLERHGGDKVSLLP